MNYVLEALVKDIKDNYTIIVQDHLRKISFYLKYNNLKTSYYLKYNNLKPSYYYYCVEMLICAIFAENKLGSNQIQPEFPNILMSFYSRDDYYKCKADLQNINLI